MLCLLVSIALAISIDEVPNPRAQDGWISDVADILDPETEARLEQRLQALHDDLTVEIAVVTLYDVEPLTPKAFATGLFNHWGIGNARANNGLLVLMVMNQRWLEMETGYGLEGVLPNDFLSQLQVREMVPHFKAGDFGVGIEAGLLAVDERLRANPEAARTGADIGNDAPLVAPSLAPQPAMDARFVDSASLEILAYGGGAGGLALLGFARVSIKRRRERTCPTCKHVMAQLDEVAEDAHLDPGQQTEESIGSIDWHVYHCDGCDFHRVVPRARIFSGYQRCSGCTNRTLKTSSRTIQPATYSSGGRVKVDERCAHCSYSNTYTRKTPKLRRPTASSGHRSGGGGSSFGGGRSRGGGAGSSW